MHCHLLFYNSLFIVRVHHIIHDITLQRALKHSVPFYRGKNQGTGYFSDGVKATNGSFPKPGVSSYPVDQTTSHVHIQGAKQQSHSGEEDSWIHSRITRVAHTFVPQKWVQSKQKVKMKLLCYVSVIRPSCQPLLKEWGGMLKQDTTAPYVQHSPQQARKRSEGAQKQ